jgi:hypothetical protein
MEEEIEGKTKNQPAASKKVCLDLSLSLPFDLNEPESKISVDFLPGKLQENGN